MSVTDITNPSKVVSVTPSYQALANANPYVDRDYKKSPWQDFLSAVGFRTGADAWSENMATQAAEYDAAIQQKMHDEAYNTPQAQMARMRAAGLNPDIDGGSNIDAGQAVGMPEDPSTPMQSTGDEGTILSIGSGILNAFSTALGVVQSIQGVATRNLQNRMSIIDLANNQFGNFIPKIGEGQEYDFNSVVSDSLEMAKMYAGNNLPKRFRNRFVNTIQGFWNNAPKTKEAYDEWSKRVSSKRDYAVNSQTMFDEFSDVLWPIAKEIADMNTEIFHQNQRTELEEGKAAEETAKTEQDYQKELNGTLAADATNEANQASKNTSHNVSIVTSHIKNIMDGLEKSSQEGGLKGALSSIALSIISGIYLYVQSGMHPHWSSSSSSGHFEGKAASGSNQSTSHSLGF